MAAVASSRKNQTTKELMEGRKIKLLEANLKGYDKGS